MEKKMRKKVAMTAKQRGATKVHKAAKPAATIVSTSRQCDTKLAQLQGLLRRPGGATVATLSRELNWQTHSVRGVMAGALKRKLGLRIVSEKPEGGERTYRIVA
jgi:hypothetical protein